jgi:catechol 2,3-dioxygenase-like lactoylglutathione lyase family enzyme
VRSAGGAGASVCEDRPVSERPQMSVTSVTIGAPDPRKLAAFYARLLGWPVVHEDPPPPGAPPEDGWAQLRPPPGGTGPTLNFEYEAQFVRPTWPSVAGHQNSTEHLDILVADLTAAVAWAGEAGAVLADFQPQEHVRVMFDPAGHPFCLFTAEG